MTPPNVQLPATAAAQFAADVVQGVLGYIDEVNRTFHYFVCIVTHAWTDGPMIYLVYRDDSSDRIWGLVRDTRSSSFDGAPWLDLRDAVAYTYILDIEEPYNCTSLSRLKPDVINWFGDRHNGLPVAPSDIAEEHRYTSPTGDMGTSARPDAPRIDVVQEPHRYADSGCLPPGIQAP